jgi:PAS domain S-box-containing protein
MSNPNLSPEQLRQENAQLREQITFLETAEGRRKQAELTLRAATEEWEQSFNALTDDVFILDRSGVILWANKAVRERFQSSYGSLIGIDYRLLYYGSLQPDVRPPCDSVLSGALSAIVEVWLSKLEGWFLVSCYPLYDVEGKQWGAISVIKDITDRKRVEEALRGIAQGAPATGSVAFFRSLVKDLAKALDVPYAFLAEFKDAGHTQAHTVAVWANGKFSENFTWNIADTPGRDIIKNRVSSWGSDLQDHYPNDILLNNWGVHSYMGSPLFNSVGQVIGIMVTMDHRPLSKLQLAESILGVFAVRAASELERKRAEEALRDNEERYRAIAENAYDLIFETQPDGAFLYLSPSCLAVLGYPLEELSNHNFFELVHPDERMVLMTEYERKIGELEDWQMLCRLRHHSGEWRWFESHMKPFRATPGNLVAVVVSRDITERRRLEEERLRATKLESIGILAGGIAHDFNNILTAVFANIGLAKMLSAKPEANLNPSITERLSAAEKACLRARDLTKQLLTFARGGTPLKNQASISRFINETADFALRGSNVRCDLHFPDDLWPVEVDEGQMSQVIQNLIINADHAMPEGGIMRIQAYNTTLDGNSGLPLKPGPYVCVSISDQGIGIAQEHLPKIFDPYFTTKQKGSGLGLATTYSIIHRHEGHITVSSEVQVGTTFTIYLPASLHVKPVFKDVETDVITGIGKLLVMDDEEDIREILGKMLSHLGYDVEFANDGAEACTLYKEAFLSKKPYVATIMDLTIPGGIGGREAIRQLQEIDPHVVALVSSGYSNDPVMSDPHNFGFKGIVIKPYNLFDLGKALHSALENKSDPNPVIPNSP